MSLNDDLVAPFLDVPPAPRTPKHAERDGNSEKGPASEHLLPHLNRASSFRKTMINTTKCFIGAASFELPWAFMQAGLVGSVAGVCFLAAISSFSLQRLAMCPVLVHETTQARAIRSNTHEGEIRDEARGLYLTYPAIGRVCFGAWGEAVSWFGVLAMTLGVAGSYFVFIATTMAELTDLDMNAWLAITLVVVSVFSWLRRLSVLAYTSAFGIMALILAVVVTSVDAAQNHTPNVGDLDFWKWDTYPLFLGNAGFLYLISTAILPLAQDMETPERFPGALNNSIVFVTLLNLAFAIFAWASYGSCDEHHDDDDEKTCVQSNVIDNLTAGGLATTVKLLLCVDLLFTSIMFLYPVNEAIEEQIFGPPKANPMRSPHVSFVLDEEEGRNHLGVCGQLDKWITWKKNMVRTCLAVAVALVAHLVPSFSLLTGLTGGFGNNILGFILPPVYYWTLKEKAGAWVDEKGKRIRVFEQGALLFTFLFGCFFLVLSTYSFIAAIASS